MQPAWLEVPLSFAHCEARHNREQRGDELSASSATILRRLPSYEPDVAAHWLSLLAERAESTRGEREALAREGAADAACRVLRAAPRHGRLQAAGLMLLQQVAASAEGARAVLDARATSVAVAQLGCFFDAKLDPPPPPEPLISIRCLSLLLALGGRCGGRAVEVFLENGVVHAALRSCYGTNGEAGLAVRLLLSLVDARGAAHQLLVERTVPAVLHA
eukprot:943852-Prymnesium_polylepis.1